jgi:hypothetical protein
MQMQKKSDNDGGERGSGLILVVFTVFLIMLVVSAIFALSRQNFMSVNKDEHSAKAEYAAKAGIEHAISMLADDNTIGAVSVSGADGVSFVDIPLENDPEITYDLQLINNDAPPNTDTLVPAPDGLQIPPGVVWVKSTGALRDRANSSSSSLIKLVGYQRPILKQSLFGINFVQVTGNSIVEAYDSSLSFPNIPPSPAVPPAGMGRRGDIGVNATSYSLPGRTGIYIETGSTVHGQLRAGVGAPSTASVITVSGVQDNLEDTVNPRVVSQEATQVPRFVLGKDPNEAGFAYAHHLVVQNLAAQPSASPSAPWVYKAIVGASPTPVETWKINNTEAPGHPGQTPTPDQPRTGYDELRIVNPGFYDMTADGGAVTLEDVVFRSGARYHFLGDVTFAGRVNIAFHNPALSTPLAFEDGPLPSVIYVDGNITFAPDVRFNMDWEDEDGDGDTTEPLPSRRIQVYTANDRGEQFTTDTHTVTVGGGASRSKVSAVLCGSNMVAEVDNTDFWGGIQGLDITVKGGSHCYFDTGLWGVPLEGRGQMAILLNTVQVYAPIVAPAPPSTVTTGPSTGPTYTTYTYGPGYCSPIIPLPQQPQYCF